MGKKIFYIIVIIVVAIALYYFLGTGDNVAEGPTPGNNLPVEQEFEGKIVYTTDTELDSAPFESDCETRGGVFNSCGTVCEPGADMCAQVCAYTCDLEDVSNVEDLPELGEEGEIENGTTTDVE